MAFSGRRAWLFAAALIVTSACGNPSVVPPPGGDDPAGADDPAGTQRLNARTFSVAAPPGWQYHELAGVDSYVGEFSGDGVTLRFDYGWYSDPLSAQNYPGHTATDETIDGRKARIVVPNVVGRGIVGVHFPELGDKTKLTMAGNDLTAAQQATALAIFRSIRFD